MALVCLLAALVWTAPHLPARVASHFNAAGATDGWMSRRAYLWTIGGTAVGMTALLLGIFFSMRYIPKSVINLPHRDYWLAPERRADTFAIIECFGLWMAVLQTLLVLGVHLLVVEANELQPPMLSPAAWWLMGGFLAATLGLVVALLRRFGRPPVHEPAPTK